MPRILAVASILGLLAVSPQQSGASDPAALPFVRVSPRDNRYFELDDAAPYVPIGLNMISPGGLDTDAGLAVVDRWFGRLAAEGGNFARIWLSSPFWDVEHERAGVFDEALARRIDALLRLARKHKIRLKLTLEHFREIDPDAGYSQTWSLKPLHHVSRGGPARSIVDWFDGRPARDMFCKKLDWYAARYGDDPIVFGWELWNEVNAVRGGDVMTWSEAMLPELQRRFSRNLAMQSLGSFDTDANRSQYRRLALMPENDVAQVHRYLDLGARLEVCHGPVDVLAAEAVRELLAADPGRPVLLAESGAVEPRHSGPFKLYEKDKQGMLLHDVLFAPFFAGAAGPGHCWHWDVYVDRNDLWWQFGRFARAVEGVDPPAEKFTPRMLEHDRLRVYALVGKSATLLWCRDKQNTWQTELADGTPPGEIRDANLNVDGIVPQQNASARIYDPWQDGWQTAPIVGGRLALPPFTRSIVVRIGEHP
ncbi:MAG: glycoside hydrolase 5 family protein [Thermoguttaceae bacterium]